MPSPLDLLLSLASPLQSAVQERQRGALGAAIGVAIVRGLEMQISDVPDLDPGFPNETNRVPPPPSAESPPWVPFMVHELGEVVQDNFAVQVELLKQVRWHVSSRSISSWWISWTSFHGGDLDGEMVQARHMDLHVKVCSSCTYSTSCIRTWRRLWRSPWRLCPPRLSLILFLNKQMMHYRVTS